MSAGTQQLPRWVDFVLLPVINLAAAFLVAGLVVLIIGENPLEAVEIMLYGAWGYSEGIGFTLYYATNFICTGLAVAVALHCGLFNIGGEGQAYMGGLGVALACLLLDGWPWFAVLPVALIAALLFGAAWAAIPGYLTAKRGSHVVITTIMFNFIATALLGYLLVNVINNPASMQPETVTFQDASHLPFMHEIFAAMGLKIGASPLNPVFIIALVACFFVWVLIWRTRLGYEIRTLGYSAQAAHYAGMPVARLTVIAMLISGALAGLMGLNEVMGVHQRLILGFTSGYGFVGIAVALMGRGHPVGVIVAAILFGMLYQGGAELSFEKNGITRDMIVVIQGLVILFTGALENMFRPALAQLFSPAAKSADAV